MTRFDPRVAAYHEAGHAVAAYFLHVPILYVTTRREDDAAGHVAFTPLTSAMKEKLEYADYASAYGGSVDQSTRRWVEARVMVTIAGGLVAQQAMGLADNEVGSGLVELPDREASALAAKHGGEVREWKRVIEGGDQEDAHDLVVKVSGTREEAGAYLEWLRQRTLSLLSDPAVWLAVEALTAALIERETLSAAAVRKIIRRELYDRRSHSHSGSETTKELVRPRYCGLAR